MAYKGKEKYFVRKRVKVGQDYVLKETEVDLFSIVDENGVSIGETLSRIDELENRINKQDEYISKIKDSLENRINSFIKIFMGDKK